MTQVRRVQGTVLALALRPVKSKAVIVKDTLELSPQAGVIGDHGISRRRQISLLDETSWNAACIEVDDELHWTTRRSNVLVSGLDLQILVGSQIRIGSALVEVMGEVVPCHVMDAAKKGLKRALKPDWRGGVFGRVIESGQVNVGDKITLHSSQ